jgi:hypothetical protein
VSEKKARVSNRGATVFRGVSGAANLFAMQAVVNKIVLTKGAGTPPCQCTHAGVTLDKLEPLRLRLTQSAAA